MIKQLNSVQKNVVKQYLGELDLFLSCDKETKKNFFAMIRERINDLQNEHPRLTLYILYQEIGSPEEIARGFETNEMVEQLIEIKKKRKKGRIILGILAAIVLPLFVYLAAWVIVDQLSYW